LSMASIMGRGVLDLNIQSRARLASEAASTSAATPGETKTWFTSRVWACADREMFR
jgi:hypothetical protein